MKSFLSLSLPLLVLGCVFACGSSDDDSTFGDPTLFGNTDGGGALGDGGRLPDGRIVGNGCEPNLTGTLRDFQDSHPNFEDFLGTDKGIVQSILGADFKPVYNGGSPTTTDNAAFDQWYRNVPGVNEASTFTLTLTPGANGISTFDSQEFFPLDGKGFGNQGRAHNYHFTFELHTEFIYNGGEVFTFTGDDDLFTFINGKLAINLGGVHTAQTASVDLDEKANELGIVKGTTYEMSIFHAERHTSESHFRIDTSIAFTNCNPIIR